MHHLELLAPARTADIGIAAIDCGADAVYIGGPGYGARKDAGNSMADIRRLCSYAHGYGVSIYLTVNTLIYDSELEEVHGIMRDAQTAGVDAFIVQDPSIMQWDDISVPLHASTQCAIRTPERARYFEALGCSRLVLERELSLDQVREIAASVQCEIECFVHGALCVCYSGQCYLSEYLDGRSANRGECIQACRSRYDLVDSSGRVLSRDKALLSLKDLSLYDRIGEMAEAGVCSFKIEGRLKNESYVKNIVREYSLALDRLVESHPDLYRRSSYGSVREGFVPNPNKTFNRGYTQLFFDGNRAVGWTSMDAPSSVGEYVGRIAAVIPVSRQEVELVLNQEKDASPLRNGDGFAFVSEAGVTGLRGDVCRGNRIQCKLIPGLVKGIKLYRNMDRAFEKTMTASPCRRTIDVEVKVSVSDDMSLLSEAVSEDGRCVRARSAAVSETALNRERMLAMIRSSLSKHEGKYRFETVNIITGESPIPLLSSATLNALRRKIAAMLDEKPCNMIPIMTGKRKSSDISGREKAEEIGHHTGELMRTKYCIRYELGLCPVHQHAKQTGPLYLVNNGRRLALGFDCRHCEMTVSAVPSGKDISI